MYARLNIPSTLLLKHLHIPKLADILNIQLSKFKFMYSKGMLAETLKIISPANSSIHSHNTRHCWDPHIVTHLTSFTARNFIHCVPQVWLDLPNDIRTILSAGQSSSKRKKHFSSLLIFHAITIALFTHTCIFDA